MLYIITGAGRGIGKYLATVFSDEGNLVYGTYNNSKPDQHEVANPGNGMINLCRVDVREESQVEDWIKSINVSPTDRLCLINCAGINYNAKLHKSDSNLWREVFSVNVFGTYYVLKAVTPIMRRNGYGRIINFSSIVPRIGVPGTSAYSASKSALWGLARSLAVENAEFDITVNTINLGYFEVGMIEEVPVDYLAKVLKTIPKGHLGKPQEVKKTIDYLVGSDYITGAEINLNGGM